MTATAAISRLTAKFQATIPLPVRKQLGLKQGDAVAFEIENAVVRLAPATPRDLAYAEALEGTLCEWNSAADEEAYRDL